MNYFLKNPIHLSLLVVLSINVSALTLDEAIDQTLKTHPDGQIALLRYESAQQESASVSSARYGRIDLNGAYYPTKTYVMPTNGMFLTKQNDGFHVDVTGVYSLWDADRTANAVLAATSAQKSVHFTQKLSQSELIEQVWQRYYGIAYAKTLVNSTESSVKFYESEYQQAHTMRLSGLKTQADELRFNASLMEARDRLEWAKSEVDKAHVALANLVGDEAIMDVGKEVLQQQAKDIIIENYTLESLRKELKNSNLRLKALQATMAQTKALSEVSGAQHYGEVMLVGSAGYDNSLSSYNSYYAGVSGTIPLYDGGKLSAQAQKSRIDYAIASLAFESSERALWQELYGAYRDLQRADTTIKAKEAVMVATSQTLTLFQERYKQGLATYIDVLESQSTFYTACLGIAEAQYQKIRAYALMQKLLNQGCRNDCKN